MNRSEKKRLLTELLAVVQRTGEFALDFHKSLFAGAKNDVEYKNDRTPVTLIDRQINQHLADFAHQNDLGFIGEEGNVDSNSRYQLLVDPIDGTGALIRGMNTSTVIASILEMNEDWGTPIMAVIHEPIGRHTWFTLGNQTHYARAGWLPKSVYTLGNSREPWFSTICTWPHAGYNMNQVKVLVEQSSRFQEQSMGAIGICGGLLASGILSAVAFPPGSAVETAAMQLIVQAAGGWVIDLEGSPLEQYQLGEYRGKADFLLPRGAIFAASEETAIALFNIVAEVNGY